MRNLYILIFCLALLPSQSFAQNGALKSAQSYYQKFDFMTAAKIYERVLKKHPGNQAALQGAADSYRFLNMPEKSEIWYGQLAALPNVDPVNIFYYAQSLRANQKYDEAKEVYKKYYKEAPDDKRSLEILKGLEMIALLGKENPIYTVSLMQGNSKESDFGPCIYKNEVLFASNRENDVVVRRTDSWTDKPFLQIYTFNPDSATPKSKPTLFKGKNPNGRYHEGPVAIDRVLNDMYVTRSNYTKRPVKSADKAVKLKIFRMVFDPSTQKWGTQIINDFAYNSDRYSCAHPTISRDGQTMFFSSDMPGGKGATDIYMSKKDGNVWGKPTNVSSINTEGNDMFPFIADDNTLYFASDGHFGLGGLDIYSVKVDEGGNYTRIANLGAPINSNFDDFALVENENGSKGYFTSNRTSGVGSDDIYQFTKEGLKLCGTVIDEVTDEKLADATVKLYEGKNLRETVKSEADGKFCFDVEPFKKYRILSTKDTYQPKEIGVEIKTESKDEVVPMRRGTGIVLNVKVIDKFSKAPIEDASVELNNDPKKLKDVKTTPVSGKVSYDIESNLDFKIIANKDLRSNTVKYLTNSAVISSVGISAPAELNVTIELEKREIYVPIVIENIYYDLDKFDIRKDAEIELDKIVKILQDNPTMEIELSSHTDCRSNAKYNMWLSAKRAEAAVNYMIRRKISPIRMVAAGYGESRLINGCACEDAIQSNCTEEQHQQNRRTEFKILRF